MFLLSGASLINATTTISNFETDTDVASWTFNNGPEYPGARGAWVAATSGSIKCAELQYDFTPITGNTELFDPHYVMVLHNITALQGSDVSEIRFLYQLSNNALRVNFRVIDSSGQTLQYPAYNNVPLSVRDTVSWRRAAILLGSTVSYWGGANDGTVHLPITKIALVLDASDRRDTGYVRFDDIEFIAAPSTTPTLDITSGTLAAPLTNTGSLAERSGVNIHFTNNNRILDLIQTTGFTWIRMDCKWHEIEQVSGVYDFTAFDILVAAAEARQLKTVAILDYGNTLYTDSAMSPPRTTKAIAAFAAYCEATARHYAGRKVVFEIWNEPDIATYWGGTPSATEYAAVLRAAIAAVKQGDSNATVLTGGLSTPYNYTYQYWTTLEGLGAITGADGWGTHLYTSSRPEERWTHILRLNDSVARVLPAKALWCTEWGYSTTNLSTSSPLNGFDAAARHLQAKYVARELLVGWWANLPLLVIYDIYDDGADSQNKEYNFGLLTSDYSEKPAMAAVRTLMSFAKNRSLAGLLEHANTPTGVHVMRLDGSTDKVYIVWAEETAQTFSMSVPNLDAQITDMAGKALAPTKLANALSLTVTPDLGPIYVRISTDITAPSAPTNVVATATSATATTVSWKAATDNIGVASYKVYRGSGSSPTTLVASNVLSTSYSDTGLASSTTYRYAITAVDAAGNESAKSALATVTTAVSTNTIATASTTAELAAAITRANANPSPATTIKLAAGTYTITSSLPDLAAKGLSIEGPASGTAVIESSASYTTTLFNITADQTTLHKLTIRHPAAHGIYIQPGADEGTIENCSFSYSTKSSISGLGCSGWLVSGNTFHAIAGTSASAEPAVHFYDGAIGTFITYNLFLDCDQAVTLGSGTSSTHVGGKIQNNFICDNRTVTFDKPAVSLESTTQAEVDNNTLCLAGMQTNAVEYSYPSSTDLYIRNNLSTKPIAGYDSASAVLLNNLSNALDSWFVNPAACDLHLKTAVASVIKAGAVIPDLITDIDADPRSLLFGVDIGADEYVESPGTSSPSPGNSGSGSATATVTGSGGGGAPNLCFFLALGMLFVRRISIHQNKSTRN